MRWKFHPGAAGEYLAACRYYAEIDGEIGEAFFRGVEAAIARIVAQPKAWPQIEEDVRRHLLKRFPFCIYYTIETDFLLIVAIMHFRRRPGHWRKRLSQLN